MKIVERERVLKATDGFDNSKKYASITCYMTLPFMTDARVNGSIISNHFHLRL